MRINLTFANHEQFVTNVEFLHAAWAGEKVNFVSGYELLQREIDEMLAWYRGRVEVVDVPYDPPTDFNDFKFLNGEDALVDLYNEMRQANIVRAERNVLRHQSWGERPPFNFS